MQLNAINSVGFKGNCQHNKQESCPECEFNFEDKKAIAAFDKFQNVVASEDIKGPGAIVASIGCAAGKTFAKGAGTALILDKFTKDGAISKGFEDVLKKGSKIAKNVAEKITTADAKGFKKLGNIAAKGINNLSISKRVSA